MSRVMRTPVKIPQNTSVVVCHNLSFNLSGAGVQLVIDSVSSWSSRLIRFKKVACCHASYLTFAASYQNKNEKVTAKANSNDSIPALTNTNVHILAAIPLCTDGKPHEDHKEFSWNFLSTI